MKDLKKISIKIKSKLKLSFLFLLLFLLTGCSENGLSFRYYNSKGVKSFNNNYFSESQAEFQKASQKSKEGSYISDNNHALASYSLANYQESVEKIQAAIKSQCDNKENDYCDQLYYNLGNALYRLGENSEKDSIKLWQEAIQAYQKDLEINKDDKEAQENIEFIKNKIAQKQEQQKNQQDKNQGEKQNQQNSKQENKSSESQDGQSQEGGEEKNDEQQSRANSKESESEGQKLDQATNQKIENYMKQLEEQSKQNQKYLNQNPEAKNNQDDFFDNSFLQEFFGNNSQGGFNNKNPNEVDW